MITDIETKAEKVVKANELFTILEELTAAFKRLENKISKIETYDQQLNALISGYNAEIDLRRQLRETRKELEIAEREVNMLSAQNLGLKTRLEKVKKLKTVDMLNESRKKLENEMTKRGIKFRKVKRKKQRVRK